MAIKVCFWNEYRKWGVDVQANLGEPLAASERYQVEPEDLLANDGRLSRRRF